MRTTQLCRAIWPLKPCVSLSTDGIINNKPHRCKAEGIKNQKGRIAMKYVCSVCGWEYDESAGYPEEGIAPGTPWSEVPESFECPMCGVGKDSFEKA